MTPELPTKVSIFLKRARECYHFLEINNDKDFMISIGVNPNCHKNWYNQGIRRVYWKILELLEENKKLKEENKCLKEKK